MKRKKRSKEEGHMSALIRRRMIQRDHGDKSKKNILVKKSIKRVGVPTLLSYIYRVNKNKGYENYRWFSMV